MKASFYLFFLCLFFMYAPLQLQAQRNLALKAGLNHGTVDYLRYATQGGSLEADYYLSNILSINAFVGFLKYETDFKSANTAMIDVDILDTENNYFFEIMPMLHLFSDRHSKNELRAGLGFGLSYIQFDYAEDIDVLQGELIRHEQKKISEFRPQLNLQLQYNYNLTDRFLLFVSAKIRQNLTPSQAHEFRVSYSQGWGNFSHGGYALPFTVTLYNFTLGVGYRL